MAERDLRILRIVVIIAVIIGFLAIITFAFFGFGLFTTAFVYGLAIWLLIIIILALIILAIYLWVRTFLLKREVKKLETRLEQAEIELNNCRSQLRQFKNEPK